MSRAEMVAAAKGGGAVAAAAVPAVGPDHGKGGGGPIGYLTAMATITLQECCPP